jgi:hypothetical protein
MRKAKTEREDWLRPEYKRSDLGEIVRGKYAVRLGEATSLAASAHPRQRQPVAHLRRRNGSSGQ